MLVLVFRSILVPVINVLGFRQAAPVVIAAACIMFAGFVPEGDATLSRSPSRWPWASSSTPW